MAASINAQTTSNNYTAACTLQDLPPGRVNNLQISTAAVYVTLQQQYGDRGFGDRRWGDERFMLPVVGSMGAPGVTGIKFRSAAAGVPAVVSCTIE